MRLEIEMLAESFRLSGEELSRFLEKPIERDLYRRGLRVQASAKRHARGRPGPNVITGRLWGSISIRVGHDAHAPYVDVGSAVHYAPMVELGHRNTAHLYPIYTPGGTFTGRFGFVSSKPTRAYPFLRPALEAARTT